MHAYFIADLHLHPGDRQTLEHAANFFTHKAPEADAVYILGDFVEYWIGDDAYDGSLETALEPLRKLPSSGTKTYLMHGNRDFLLGNSFASKQNLILLADDTHLLQTDQTRLLLMHGDTLCTDDAEYMQLRSKLRDKQWQQHFLTQSIGARQTYARSLRAQSQSSSADKPQAITDVNQATVNQVMTEFNVELLLHGHTHKPAIHDLSLVQESGQTVAAKRFVVGDWHPDTAQIGQLKNGQIDLLDW